jgi:ABC-2 type transport system ATP-binding protein
MTVTSHPAILVEGVHKSFGSLAALDGVDLAAPAGNVLGLLGPNGAGKTTLVRILTTLLRPDSGRVEVDGIDVLRDPGRVRAIMGLAGQYPAVDENLTGFENLEMVGQLYHLSRRDARARARELLERFALTDAGDRVAKNYSGGMRRRLDLAASITGFPRILFLDEPTTGLDIRTRLELWDHIRELVRNGATLLLTTQYLDEADELADRIVVIDHGRIIAEGTSAELKREIGSDVLEIRFKDRDDLMTAASALQRIGSGAPNVDAATASLTIPVSGGVDGLIESVRLLDTVAIKPEDIHVRRPSLDDVFLTLTGHPTDASGASNGRPATIDQTRSLS